MRLQTRRIQNLFLKGFGVKLAQLASYGARKVCKTFAFLCPDGSTPSFCTSFTQCKRSSEIRIYLRVFGIYAILHVQLPINAVAKAGENARASSSTNLYLRKSPRMNSGCFCFGELSTGVLALSLGEWDNEMESVDFTCESGIIEKLKGIHLTPAESMGFYYPLSRHGRC